MVPSPFSSFTSRMVPTLTGSGELQVILGTRARPTRS